MDLCNAETVTNTLLQVTIMYDVTFFYTKLRGASPLACRVASQRRPRIGRNSRLEAHHGHVADTPSQSREHNQSVNVTFIT